jgi:hypothetical protein
MMFEVLMVWRSAAAVPSPGADGAARRFMDFQQILGARATSSVCSDNMLWLFGQHSPVVHPLHRKQNNIYSSSRSSSSSSSSSHLRLV